MILYIEKQVLDYPQTKKIIQMFKEAKIIFIDNYKNIFDKNLDNLKVEKSIIIAKLTSNPVGETPIGYGHTKYSYFFKTSLNCIFDCKYCYLKGAFKNENIVFFVNYEDIKESIILKTSEIKKETIKEDIWFYSSDYSDILGMDNISSFISEFVPFFESLDGVKMEIRTKSVNIKPLLDLGFVPKNTEIAFSLNPEELINKYEIGTAKLDSRIKAINTLLDRGFKVGVRFLPLLPVKNYKEIYGLFVDKLKKEIDFSKINSTFASGLLYTKKDYNNILKKYRKLDILYMLELNDDDFYRESKELREYFYKLFKNLDNKCLLCLEN